MKLFGRWKKGDGGEEATHTHNIKTNINNKPHLIGSKHGLFDNIVGFDDVKALFEMAIGVKDPYIYCCVVLHHLGNHCS